MSSLAGMTDKQLRDKKAALTAEREASKDDAARKRLREEIRAIDDEFDRRALDAGKQAGKDVTRAEDGLDEVRNAEDLDALSALRRTADRVRGDGETGNG